jgi:ribosomal protein L37AE/L43A
VLNRFKRRGLQIQHDVREAEAKQHQQRRCANGGGRITRRGTRDA